MLYTWVGVQPILQLSEDKIEDMVGIKNTPEEWSPIEKCETDASRKILSYGILQPESQDNRKARYWQMRIAG